jgi:hypothetical protein
MRTDTSSIRSRSPGAFRGSEQDVSDAARGPVRLSAGRSSAEVQPERVRCSGRSIQEVRAVLVLDRAMRMA